MRKDRQGFTLVEIMIVVAVIGLIAAMAIPSMVKARTRAHVTRIANDLRIFSAAFERYCMDNGRYPADTHNTLPAGMEDYIKPKQWELLPLGGHYNWEGPTWGEGGTYPYAGIALFETEASDTVLRQLDTIVDNGNLLTGCFRKTPNSRWTYIIEER
jgi:prepilin-type N-terminal cleavage/methylation domain-containing protein